MTIGQDPFKQSPELRHQIKDPLSSFFRTFRRETIVEQHPELAWVLEFFHSDEVREKNRVQVLKDHPQEDLWIFAYGSLMWDPAFMFSEVRRAHVADYERRFILKEMYGGRGSRDAPGLMAALDHGCGCDGLIFRIPQDIVDVETEILWRREFIAPGYIPTFIDALSDGQSFKALTFVADYEAEQICGDISRTEQIKCLLQGNGILGTSLEYLENVVAHFQALEIRDEDSEALLNEARAALDEVPSPEKETL